MYTKSKLDQEYKSVCKMLRRQMGKVEIGKDYEIQISSNGPDGQPYLRLIVEYKTQYMACPSYFHAAL